MTKNEATMTRRGFVLAGGVAGAMALAGCGGTAENAAAPEETETKNEQVEQPAEDAETTDAATSDGSAPRILVAYYSRADENYGSGGTEWLEVGHTKVMAGYIAEALGADTYEIVPEEAYPEGYDDCCDVALEEQRSDARPKIAGELPDISSYEMIFLGCPIWWGDEPMIVRTFIEALDFDGKVVVPFTTHGGSGLGSVPANLQAALPGALFLDGLAVAGTSVDGAHDEVVDWAKGYALA